MAANAPPDLAAPKPRASTAGGWARYFGYDIFISFALGPLPRGCRTYASDLARRLRERGFTVFFSEDEAPVGAELDGTLRRALRRSRILVVVANRGTLADPRWVRVEIEAYRVARPRAAIVPISVDGALQEPALAEQTQPWLPFAGRIWIDESAQACETGRVSDDVVERLVTAPHAVRSVVRLRAAIALTLAGFALLAAFALLQRNAAIDERDRAQQRLLSSAAQQALLLSRDGRAHEGWDALVDALAQAQPRVDGALPEGFLEAALTALVENRRGPTLAFDTQAPTPAAREEGDVTPPAFAFDATGARVAVAAGTQVAVWSTADGRRLAQVALPLLAEQLTFAAGGAVLVAEGPEPAPPKKAGQDEAPEAVRVPRAAAVDLAPGTRLGHVTALPLSLCEGGIPCIGGDATTTKLLRLSELPARARPPATAYLATAAGAVRVWATSGQRFVLISRDEPGAPRSWQLLDRQGGGVLALQLRLRDGEGDAGATNYNLASDAPVLVASAINDSAMAVFRIEPGPVLVPAHRLQARQASATQGVQLDAQGRTLRYQNYRYGTGTGVGVGRTVVLDVDSGHETWARGEGEVAWGDALVALQEDWAETHVLAADTGATWFIAPGRPLGFDPTGRMLLMWDRARNGTPTPPWPQVRLLETLPVRQFARDPRGPASTRSACLPFGELHFLTLAERPDRLWNRDDWHRLPTVKAAGPAASAALFAATPPSQSVHLRARGPKWRLLTDDESKPAKPVKPVDMDRAQVARAYPLLAADLRPGKDLEAVLTVSPDGRWTGVVTRLDEPDAASPDPACKAAWARWRLHRGQEPQAVQSGCTTGDQAGPGQFPEVQFLPADAQAGVTLLAAVPADTCRVELLDPESGQTRGTVIPAFGNGLKLARIAPDLLAVSSTDWYGATLAYQLHRPGTQAPGPVFMIADRNAGDDDNAPAKAAPAARALYPLSAASEADAVAAIEAAFEPGGRVLKVAGPGGAAAVGVPPWGQRLREQLRQAVQAHMAATAAASAPR